MHTRLMALTGVLLATALFAGDFTKTMSTEEQARAGLGKLSEAELDQLKVAVERYKTGVVAETKKEADTRVAAAEEKARKAEAKQTADTADKRPSWLKALITLERTGTAPDKADVFESRIKGEFTGWRGRTIFTLENGQRWQQANDGEYVDTPRQSPKVWIRPAGIGYWMEIEGVGERLRVKPVRLE